MTPQMRLYDISVSISGETPTYPGDPPVTITAHQAISRGDASNVSHLSFGAHTATHVDAPAHFLEGAAGIDAIPIERLIGEASVVEIPDEVRAITADAVRRLGLARGARRILFKTRNSRLWREGANARFCEDYTFIALDGARALLELGIGLVGVDYLSVERFETEGFETHKTLLSAGVIIVEGLDLGAVPAGVYELICLPLKIRGGTRDGAPARAVLRSLDRS